MQHLDPNAQVAIKQRVMLDALWHIGKVKPEMILAPIFGPFWGYRHRARLTVRDVAKKGGVLVGFHERSSSYVADMTECKILPQPVSDLLIPLRRLIEGLSIRQRLPQVEVAMGGNGAIALVFRVLDQPTQADLAAFEAFSLEFGVSVWLQPKGPDSCYPMHESDLTALKLELPEFGVHIAFKPTDFTQVNHRLNETMVSRAIHLLDVHPDHHVADFFCGLGNFTLPLAVRAQKVVGIEGSDQLVERARAGAVENHLGEKTQFVARNLFTWNTEDWDKLWEQMGGIDRVLIDPPREGALEVARTLAATDKRPARLVYVSCNPATLARDCAILHHEGGWHIRMAGVMNMFPHTAHVETVVLLSKLNTKQHIEVELNLDELDLTSAESKATYEEIKAYVLEHTGLKVSHLYIAQVKQKYGIIERENYNKPKSESSRQPKCPPEKEAAITEALKFFRMI